MAAAIDAGGVPIETSAAGAKLVGTIDGPLLLAGVAGVV